MGKLTKDFREIKDWFMKTDNCKDCGCTAFECRHCVDLNFMRHIDDRKKFKENCRNIREWFSFETIKVKAKEFLILKEGVIYDLNTDKPSVRNKKELCLICKLNITCQNNFDYECVEASDFLFTPNNIFRVKDDFLDSLIDKDNIGLRDKEIISEKELEKRILDSLTVEVNGSKWLRVICDIVVVGMILMFVGYVIFGIIN